ncbi:hypothetical protein [Erwinia tracheiphila]
MSTGKPVIVAPVISPDCPEGDTTHYQKNSNFQPQTVIVQDRHGKEC